MNKTVLIKENDMYNVIFRESPKNIGLKPKFGFNSGILRRVRDRFYREFSVDDEQKLMLATIKYGLTIIYVEKD